ncbi:PqqD family protein [Thermomonas carbonis]|uniref:PqqD family protein n=1 Tax=Thermomonas carbonis TaxID=1463158 RepID=A0A7G9SN63_9GAMM|nr:PqqD family protein [Thermomonas carbonis]QNN69288.1 PqqD family protein [Thermomonas carbonis]GHC05469.1 hypothetical protein GCM10010080_19110 [Thermomonas carbonis]
MTVTTQSVTLASKVVASDDVLMQAVGDEVVLLDLASERYFGLDPVGTRIWELLPEREDLAAIHLALCDEFAAEPSRIEQDLLSLVQTLSEAGLVKVA